MSKYKKKHIQAIVGQLFSIFIIGLINLYVIYNNGLISQFPTQNKLEGIININEQIVLILLFINILFAIIFYISNNLKNKKKNKKLKAFTSLEFYFLLFIGLIGLNLILISSDFLLMFIGIELYSISIYVLILSKLTRNTTRLSMIYLLVNSLSSFIFLLAISIIYKYTGSLSIDYLLYFINNHLISNYIFLAIFLISISLLIKLGTVPFNFWVLRLYTSLDYRILLYQLTIPKIVYLCLLFKLIHSILPFILNSDPNSNFFFYLLYFISILSILIGSIGGLFHNKFKALFAYSSILNVGIILLGLSSNLSNLNQTNFSYIEYLLIYTINTLALFFCLLLIHPKTSILNTKIKLRAPYINTFFNRKFPFYTICILISIFSFIGIPPFAGFFGKLNIFYNILHSYNFIEYSSIFFLIFGTIISACFYLKFILFFFFQKYSFSSSPFISKSPVAISYFACFFSLFLILYPFISIYFSPFFSSFLF